MVEFPFGNLILKVLRSKFVISQNFCISRFYIPTYIVSGVHRLQIHTYTLKKAIIITKGAHLVSATVPWHWLFFCPAPKIRVKFGCPVTKSLKAPKWHWLILAPMGALAYKQHF